MMNNRINFKIMILTIIIFYSSMIYAAVKNKKPEWIDKACEIEGFICGVGGPSKDINESIKLAYTKISEFIGVEVNSYISKNKEITAVINQSGLFKKKLDRIVEDDFYEEITSSTASKLFGVIIKERWQNKKTREWWIFATMPKENIDKVIKEKTIFINSLNNMLKTLKEKHGSKINKIVLGNFTIQGKDIMSDFSIYLEKLMTSIIIENNYFKIYNKSHFFTEIINRNIDPVLFQTGKRGIDLVKKEMINKNNEIKSEADAILYGEYWTKKDSIEFLFYVNDTKTCEYIYSENFDILLNKLPQGISFDPSNNYDVNNVINKTNLIPVKNNELNISVSTDKWIYKVGEKMIINIKSNSDCYIKVFYITADGELYMIFPNKFDTDNKIMGNKLYTLGDEKYAFDFKLTPPYGVEIIKVIASNEQFADLKGIKFNDTIILFGNAKVIDVVEKMKQGLNIDGASAIADCMYNVVKE